MPWEGHERWRHSNPYTSQKETFHQKLNPAGIFILNFLASRIVRIWISVKLPSLCSFVMGALPACMCAQSCPALCDSMDCSLPDSSVCGILQARILVWVAISFSRGSSRPRDRTCVSYISCTGRRIFFFFFYHCTTSEDLLTNILTLIFFFQTIFNLSQFLCLFIYILE